MQNRYRPYTLNSLWALLGANVALFVFYFVVDAYLLEGDTLVYLALDRDYVWPYLWTIITSMFMHGSLWHLLINMWVLYLFGSYIIMLVGERKFLLVYFSGGIAGGLLFIALSRAPVVGASGAVYALGAMLAVMKPNLRVIMFPLFIPIPLWVAILLGFVVTSFASNIAWQAHLGGAIVGVLFGLYFRRKQQRIIFIR